MSDPMAERYFNVTQYGFCINNPVNYIDLWGLDVWTTSDPDIIRQIMEGMMSTGTINTSGMTHYTDDEFFDSDIDTNVYMNQTDNGNYYFVWKTSDSNGVQVNSFKFPSLWSMSDWHFEDFDYERNSDILGSYASGLGIFAGIAEELMYSEDKHFGTWMGRDWKIRSQRWGGNGITGGKLKYAKRISRHFYFLGKAAAVVSIADTEMLYRQQLITKKQRWLRHGSTAISAIPLYGTAWAIGWEAGQMVREYME